MIILEKLESPKSSRKIHELKNQEETVEIRTVSETINYQDKKIETEEVIVRQKRKFSLTSKNCDDKNSGDVVEVVMEKTIVVAEEIEPSKTSESMQK